MGGHSGGPLGGVRAPRLPRPPPCRPVLLLAPAGCLLLEPSWLVPRQQGSGMSRARRLRARARALSPTAGHAAAGRGRARRVPRHEPPEDAAADGGAGGARRGGGGPGVGESLPHKRPHKRPRHCLQSHTPSMRQARGTPTQVWKPNRRPRRHPAYPPPGAGQRPQGARGHPPAGGRHHQGAHPAHPGRGWGGPALPGVGAVPPRWF